MTRGKIALLVNENKLLTSVEFNGDMYYEGHGQQVVEGLEKVKTEQDYRDFVVQFDNECFGYANDGTGYFDNAYWQNGVREIKDGEEQIEDYLDFTHNYFDKWFSDYVYLKNNSEEAITIIAEEENTENNIKVLVEPNGIVVLNFGIFIKKHSIGCTILDREEESPKTFDGYWEMTSQGIVITDTDNDKKYSLQEVDECTIDHIIGYIRDGYLRGDLFEVCLEEWR